ncbi:MAG: ABC transporter ATP-binding protein [Sumerlaeia bacterium]
MKSPEITDPLHYRYRSNSPFKTVIFLLNLRWWAYAWLYFIFLIKHSPVWLFPICTAYLIDSLSNPQDQPLFRTTLTLGATLVFLLALNIPFQVYFFSIISRDIRRLETRLRTALMTRLHHLSFSFLDETKSGRLQSKILRDVEQVQFMCFHLGQFAPMAIMNLAVALIYTTIKEPLMLVFFALQVPLSLVLLRFFRNTMNTRNEAYRMQLESMNAYVSESIEMIPVTRAHGVEKQTEQDLSQRFVDVEKEGVRLDLFNALFGSCTWVTFQISMVNALIISAVMAWYGYISVGDVILYQGFFALIIQSIESIINSFPVAYRGIESLKSIGEVLECPDLEHNEGKELIEKVVGRVEFQDVCFAYTKDSAPAVAEFSLNVEAGKTVALVGESGSGKSTLMSLLIGFRRPDSGKILLDGTSMECIDMRSWRQHLSMVPQQPLLMSGTIRENIAYGLVGISDEQILDAIEAASLSTLIATLPDGIDTRLLEGGQSLSGGQRQRIAIARAFVRNPRIIIFDEATSALDVTTEREVQEAITRLAKGRTTFLIAHRLSTIRNADLVVVLEKGKIIEQGSLQELVAQQGAFYRMTKLQN